MSRASLVTATVLSTICLVAVVVGLPLFWFQMQRATSLMKAQVIECQQTTQDTWRQMAEMGIRSKRQYNSSPSRLAGHCCSCQQGPPGPPGSKGADGPPGRSGIIGTNGRNGRDGRYVAAEKSSEPPCQKCPSAPPGPPGNPGAKGPRGNTGTAGRNGTPGTPGRVGPPGPQGVRGPPGDFGIQGPPGDAGKVLNGAPQGPPGKSGPIGARGKGGNGGRDGHPGVAGIAGARGLQGERGPTGARGLPGPPGPGGQSGGKGSCSHCPAEGSSPRGGAVRSRGHGTSDARPPAFQQPTAVPASSIADEEGYGDGDKAPTSSTNRGLGESSPRHGQAGGESPASFSGGPRGGRQPSGPSSRHQQETGSSDNYGGDSSAGYSNSGTSSSRGEIHNPVAAPAPYSGGRPSPSGQQFAVPPASTQKEASNSENYEPSGSSGEYKARAAPIHPASNPLPPPHRNALPLPPRAAGLKIFGARAFGEKNYHAGDESASPYQPEPTQVKPAGYSMDQLAEFQPRMVPTRQGYNVQLVGGYAANPVGREWDQPSAHYPRRPLELSPPGAANNY